MELDGLRVNHAGLDTAADDIAQAVKAIDNRMDRLERELNPLRSNWAGNAQQAYTVAKGRWDGAIQEMRNLLEDTGRNVISSNQDYKNADARGAAAFDI
ncbi:MAG: WXG100 family type VII secretion target [Nocardioides sp.]|jgi:early secretory antigenic target protein ESAT-6